MVDTRPGCNPARAIGSWLVVAAVMIVVLALLPISDGAFNSPASNQTNVVSTSACFYKTSTQSGTTSNAVNGTTTVPIASVDVSKSFLFFSARHNSDRPVGSVIGGALASATSIDFHRVTDESTPATMVIRWYVVSYNCGVSVQRGSTSLNSPTVDQAITSVGATSTAFVTFSKTVTATDTAWSDNDQTEVRLTSPTNLRFESNFMDASFPHVAYWQVIRFTDASKISVQQGTTSIGAGSASSSVALASAVNTTKTFVLISSRGPTSDIGSALLRGRLTKSTTISIDRSAVNGAVTEVAWQAVSLLDGSLVQNGSISLASGTSSATVAITPVDTSRSAAMATTANGAGQSGGRTSYTADDLTGVASVTATVASSTQLTFTRSSSLAGTDIGWMAIQWGAS